MSPTSTVYINKRVYVRKMIDIQQSSSPFPKQRESGGLGVGDVSLFTAFGFIVTFRYLRYPPNPLICLKVSKSRDGKRDEEKREDGKGWENKNQPFHVK